MIKIEKIILLITIFLLFMTICESDENNSDLQNKILYVGGNNPGNYTNIQDAIENATNGDTVFVYKGIYKESIKIYKKISLTGEPGAILEYSSNDDIISVNAEGVKISGLIIRNCPGGVYFGLKIEQGTDNVTVENNVFYNNSKNSLYLYYSSYDKIIDNSFTDDGIFIVGINDDWNSHIIKNNTVNNLPIIYYKNQMNTNISDIICGQMIIANCTDINVKNNNISHGKIGISIGHSKRNIFENNYVENTMFAIRLQYSHNNVLKNNFLENNSHGFFIQHSDDNIVRRNNISYNTIDGCHLCCGSVRNKIFLNNFIKNNENAYDIIVNFWYENKTGNYWDDYEGYDKNNDHIGDISYNISSRSSDKYPLMIPFNSYLIEKQTYEKNKDFIGLNQILIIMLITSILVIILFYYMYYKKN